MQLPLFIIPKDYDIPIPHNTFSLTVLNEQADRFNPQAVIDENNKKVHKIILAIAKDSLSETLAPDIYNIGVLCSIQKQKKLQTRTEYELEVESRVLIRNFYSEDGKAITPLVYYNEAFVDGEENVIHQVKKLVSIIIEHENLFDSTLVSILKQTLGLVTKMDVIAGSELESTNQKLRYLLSTDNNDRFSIITKQIQETIKAIHDKPSSAPQAKKKRKRRSLISQDRPRLPLATPSLKERFDSTAFPKEIREKLSRDFNRLESIPKNSNEYSQLVDYLNWSMDIPWGNTSFKGLDLKKFMTELNETHYGLDEVKQHLLEHLTIERIKQQSTGTVLCFVGGPGTGKTSIAKAIAEATGRKLVRIALGGLSDEAELRGHRRTYAASRPGRLIVGLKNAKVMDPLFLLDEVDKIARHRGDPTAALLEILDPEQNDYFIDRYMEVPVDLSKAMFICTANYKDQIPPALLDRMELITFKEYKKTERRIILENFILPKAIKEYGLEEFSISFSEEVLATLADKKQVRRIEKHLKKLLRMAAVEIHVNGKPQQEITLEFAKHILNKNNTSKVGF